MDALYYEDFSVGATFKTPGRTVTETDVMMFCAASGDYTRLHTDAEFMKRSPFGQRIAHGLLGLSMLTGLFFRLGIHDGTAVAVLGIDNWRYHTPIFIGDTIHAEMTITDKRPTLHPDRGIVVRSFVLKNQRGEVCQAGVMPLMLLRKNP